MFPQTIKKGLLSPGAETARVVGTLDFDMLPIW